MCGTVNDANAQSCTFCGYLFEDYGTGTVTPPRGDASSVSENSLKNIPPPMDETSEPPVASYTSSTMPSTGTPLYLVSRSLVSTIVPSLVYLVFIGFVGLASGFSLYTLALVAFFLIVALVPALFTPRRFEFYDDSLKIHKTIGGDSEIPYSQLSMVDYSPRGRGNQIVLSSSGQRRPIVIPKNPTNQNLNMDLKQFLTGKLKKSPTPGAAGDTNATTQAGTGAEGPDDAPAI